MQLFYTTSVGNNETQADPTNSLGGFRSGTEVLNDDFGNLFGEISSYTIRENRDEYIALILQNTTGVEVANAQVWVVTPSNNYSNFQIALVSTVNDAEGNPQTERTRTRFARPLVGNFVSSSDASRIDIGTLADSATVGVWIKRTLNISNINDDQENIYERDPNNVNLYREVVQSKSDIFTVNLEWT